MGVTSVLRNCFFVVVGKSMVVTGDAVMCITRLAVLVVVGIAVTANSGTLGVVALTDLVRSGMGGESVVVVGGVGATTLTAEHAEFALAAGTRGIVVVGARSEALFLTVVAHKSKFNECRGATSPPPGTCTVTRLLWLLNFSIAKKQQLKVW